MKWSEKIEDGIHTWRCDPFIIERIGKGERERYRCFVEGWQVGDPERSLKAAKEWCQTIAENCREAL